MGVNVDAMRKDAEKKKSERKGGNFWKPDREGEYLFYVCPPCREDLDLPYMEVWEHWLGPEGNRKNAICLDPERNDFLGDARLHAFLKDKGGADATEGGCPVCEDLENATDDEKRERRSRQFWYNIVPMGYRRVPGKGDWEKPDTELVKLYAAGAMAWEQVCDIFFQEGDITDPTGAVLVKLVRSGQKKKTKYRAVPDTATLRKPMALPKALKREILDALEVGGKSDMFKMAAAKVRTRAELEKMLAGIDIDDQDEKVDPDVPPKCFKLDYMEDNECAGCPWRGPCSTHLGMDLFEGHELKEGDRGFSGDEEEKKPTKPPAKSSKQKLKEEAEEEEESEGAAADKEEEPEPPPAKKKAPPPAKKAAAPPPPAKKPEPEEEVEEVEQAEEVEEVVDQNEPAETEEEPEGDDDDLLRGLGFDDRQILRISDESKAKVFRYKLRGDWVSVLKSGGLQVIDAKLPDGHPLKGKTEAPAKEAAKPPPAKKKPEPEEEVEDEPAADKGGDLDLDALEHELRQTAKGKK